MGMPDWVETYLDTHHLTHQTMKHRPVIRSMDVAEIEQISSQKVAKVVVTKSLEGSSALLVVPAAQFVDFKKAAMVLKQPHLRLAREDEIATAFPECEVGAVPPLDHWRNVPIFVDEEGFAKDDFVFQAGSHDTAVRMKYEDWKNAVRPVSAKFATSEHTVGRSDRGSSDYSKAAAVIGAITLAIILYLLATTAFFVQSESAVRALLNGFALLSSVFIFAGFVFLAMTSVALVLICVMPIVAVLWPFRVASA